MARLLLLYLHRYSLSSNQNLVSQDLELWIRGRALEAASLLQWRRELKPWLGVRWKVPLGI